MRSITTLRAGNRLSDLRGERGRSVDVTAALLCGGVVPEPSPPEHVPNSGRTVDSIVLTTAQCS